MRKFFAVVLGLAVLVTSAPAFSESASKKADDESDDFKPLQILVHHCAACHNAPDHPGALFLSASGLEQPEVVQRVIRVIETSQMPPAHKAFKTTKDGKKLLSWLKKQKKA